MRCSLILLISLLVLSLSLAAQEEEFSFDVEKFEPRAFEFTGGRNAQSHAAQIQLPGIHDLILQGQGCTRLGAQ